MSTDDDPIQQAGTSKRQKVFISYSSRDRHEALELKQLLDSLGCEVWMDFFDIKPADVIERQLMENVGKADILCLLLSPTSVTSKWVKLEAEFALAEKDRGLRILGILLRPCSIPEFIEGTVCINAYDGLVDDAVRLKFKKFVLGLEEGDEALLLDAGFRSEVGKEEVRQQVDASYASMKEYVDRVRKRSIRELRISLNVDTIPSDSWTILELQLELDPLFSQPMSFFFARYSEGRTWPEGFEFIEPPYTEYFRKNIQRADARFVWFDKSEELNQHHAGPEFRGRAATFTLEFDGEVFHPGGPGVHLPQKFEIPSLEWLQDKGSKFRLIAHNAETKSAEYVDLYNTDIDLRVNANFHPDQPPRICLFTSARQQDERIMLTADSLSRVTHQIEREALLGAYFEVAPAGVDCRTAAMAEKQEEQALLMRALEADEFPEGADRFKAAAHLLGEADLAMLRGQHLEGLRGYERIAHLLQPVVLDGYPAYEDGLLLYVACDRLLKYFIDGGKYTRAADFVNVVGVVAQRLVQLQPLEADFRRLWADALFKNAMVHAENGKVDVAADELFQSVKIFETLYQELPNPARLRAATEARTSGVHYARKWGVAQKLPLETWLRALSPEQKHAIESTNMRSDLPVWLEPADPSGWPTVAVNSPLLHYATRVRKGWPTEPEVRPLPKEIEHIYRGQQPTEWLIVSAMDRATGGEMRNWVDGIMTVLGFPVLEMTEKGCPEAKLLKWSYAGSFDTRAGELGLDELHAYTGLAQLKGIRPTLARIYIVLARRNTFAWKVTLAFESACLPGMAEDLVIANDHVRAGATLGALRLGV